MERDRHCLPRRPGLQPTSLDRDHAARDLFARATPELVALLSAHPTIDAVGLIRRGSRPEELDFPLVLMVTGKMEEDDWSPLRREIIQILQRYDAVEAAKLPVQIFQARVELAGGTPHFPAKMGDAISVTALPWGSGSLGGFVRLTADEATLSHDDPRRKWIDRTYALTCHHVVRPTREKSDFVNTGEWTSRLTQMRMALPLKGPIG